MKQFAIIFVSFLALGIPCMAQQPEPITVFPWCEDFESGDAPGWSFIDNDGDNMNWFVADYNPDGVGGYSLFSPSYVQGQEDNWAVSPPLSLPNDCLSLHLEWRVRSLDTYQESYEVLISSGPLFDLASCDSIYGETFSGGYFSRSIDISAYRGTTIYIAFRHRSQFQNYMCIDNVCVNTDNSAHDSVSVTVNAPATAFVGEDVVLSAVSSNADSFSWTIDSAVVNTLEGASVVAHWNKPGTFHYSVTAINEWDECTAYGVIAISEKPNESVFGPEESLNYLTIFPNPATNTIVINAPDDADIELIDHNGKVLKKRIYSDKMDLSGIAPGVYFIRSSSPQGVLVNKVVIATN